MPVAHTGPAQGLELGTKVRRLADRRLPAHLTLDSSMVHPDHISREAAMHVVLVV